MTDPAPPGPRRPAVGFIFVTVVLDALATGLILPVLPGLIADLAHEAMPRTAMTLGVMVTLFAAMQVLAAPIQGALSDRFGRRPVLLVSNLGLALDYGVMALAPSLGWLFVGRALSGVASGSGPAAYAYLADVTPPANRARNFGYLFAAQALGAALGPAAGGLLAGIDPRAPFWAAAALSLVNGLYGLIWLPESLPVGLRSPATSAQWNPISALSWLIRAHPSLRAMVAVAFLLSLASQGANTVAVVYAIHRYDWSPAAIGILLTVFAIASLAAQAGLVSRVERHFGPRGAMVGSLALTAVGLFIFGLAPTGRVFALAVPFLAIGALSGAIMAGYFTGQVGDAEQGRLQGAWGSINSLMGLAAPPLFTWVFSIGASATWIGLSGAPFVLAAALVAASLLIAGRAPWPRS